MVRGERNYLRNSFNLNSVNILRISYKIHKPNLTLSLALYGCIYFLKWKRLYIVTVTISRITS